MTSPCNSKSKWNPSDGYTQTYKCFRIHPLMSRCLTSHLAAMLFTCSLNPILPVFYLDLALSIILLFSWVYSTSFSTGSISSAEIYIKLKKKIKPPSTESMRNQGPKLLCSEIHPHICLKAMASPRLLLAYAREFTSESCGTPLMVDFSFRTPSWLC